MPSQKAAQQKIKSTVGQRAGTPGEPKKMSAGESQKKKDKGTKGG